MSPAEIGVELPNIGCRLEPVKTDLEPILVYGVTGRGLLRFCQGHFGVALDQIADRRAAVGNVLEALGPYC